MVRKIYYWLFIRYLSFKWIFKINLGDYVKWKGKKYMVHNGVMCGVWTTHTEEQTINMPREECKKVLTVRNLRGSYKSGVNFYTTNWYRIWCENGVLPWMRGCNIW